MTHSHRSDFTEVGSSATCSLYLFSFQKYRYWAFKQMRLAQKPLRECDELSFFKLLGCGGGNGFSIVPDFSTYALFCVWNNGCTPSDFERTGEVFNSFLSRCTEIRRFDLQPVKGKGTWGGTEPFELKPLLAGNYPWAVLTRASIRWYRLPEFWVTVPGVSSVVNGFPGSEFSVGIGEWPLIEQATFSIWKDRESIEHFAYRHLAHSRVVKKTRERNWYSEELFYRFQLLEQKIISGKIGSE